MNKLNEQIAADLFLIYGFNALSFKDEEEWKLKTRSSSLRTINNLVITDNQIILANQNSNKEIKKLDKILREWNKRTRAILSHSNEELFKAENKTISEFENSVEEYLQEVYEANREKIISTNKDYLYKKINHLLRKYLDNKELKFRLESLVILSMTFFLYKFELRGMLSPNNKRLEPIFDNDSEIKEVLSLILEEEVVTHTEIIGDKEFQTKYDDLQIRGWNLYDKLSQAPDLTPKDKAYSFFNISDIHTLLRLISKEEIEYFSSKGNFLLEENYGKIAPASIKEGSEQKEIQYKRANIIDYDKLDKNKIYFIKISNNEFNLFFFSDNLKSNVKDNFLIGVKKLKYGEETDINVDDDNFLKNYKNNKFKWYTIHFNLKNIFSFLDKNNLLEDKKTSLLAALRNTSSPKQQSDQKNIHNQRNKLNEFQNRVRNKNYLSKNYSKKINPRKGSEIQPTFLKEFLSTTLKSLGAYLGHQNTEESERVKIDKSSIDQFYSHFYGDLNLLLAKNNETYKDVVDFQPYSEAIIEAVIDAITAVFGGSLQVNCFIKEFFVEKENNRKINEIYHLLILERQNNKQKVIANKKVFYKAFLSSFIYLTYPNDNNYEINKQELENFLLKNLFVSSNQNLSYDNKKKELTVILENNNEITFKNLNLPINREAIKLITYIFNKPEFKQERKYEFNYSKINRSKFLMTTNPIDKDTDLIQFLSNDQLVDFVIWVKNKRDALNQKEAKQPLNTIMHNRFISSEVYDEFRKVNLTPVKSK